MPYFRGSVTGFVLAIREIHRPLLEGPAALQNTSTQCLPEGQAGPYQSDTPSRGEPRLPRGVAHDRALPLRARLPEDQRSRDTTRQILRLFLWIGGVGTVFCPKDQLSPEARRRHKGLISRAGVCGWFQSVPARLRDPPSVRRGASDVGGGEELQVPHMKPGPAFAWNPSSSGPAVTSGCPTGCWSCEAGMPF